ncbi:ATP-binding cassette domain-containing protein, partial [Achromobacter xylosoxidans]
ADEPTTALDVTVQAQVLDLLAGIQREIGMAVLLITHDLAVVRNVAHHVALMRGGEIVESASAEEFFRAPKHPYARQLFDAIPTFEKRGVPLSQAGRAAQARDAARKRPREPGVVLDVQDLKVHYPVRKGPLRRVASWVKAVDGVTFTLRAGETLALLGESGCGKTTTGKALLRLIDGARISGRAMLQGQDLLTADRARLQRLRQDIQIVFQDPYASLDPRMRVGDILDEGLESLRRGMGARERRDRAVRLVERVGLPANTLARYPHEFSGGQRQR